MRSSPACTQYSCTAYRSKPYVPEKENDKLGRKRERAAKDRGYMLVFTHADVDGKGSNKIAYTLETKELRI